MAQRLRRFNRRSPRYSVGSQDIRHLRLARKTFGHKRLSEAEIINVSESGLAFRIPMSVAPRVGEYIMLEFTAPGANKMAWYARVVRVELPSANAQWKTFSNAVLVGLEFHKLPTGFQRELRKGLQIRWKQLEQQTLEERLKFLGQYLVLHWKTVLWSVLAFIATVVLMWVITRPTPNYDPAHPSAWGERKW